MISRCAKLDSPRPMPRCPEKAAPDRKRSEALLARLRTDESGKRMIASLARELTICYGEVREGVVQSDGVIVLQRDRPLPANAARLGHLILHLVAGLPLDETAARTSSLSCNELVKYAGEAEKRAHTFECELRKAFGLDPLPFEDLSAAYAKRCQVLHQK
jgi:hypothetical protein